MALSDWRPSAPPTHLPRASPAFARCRPPSFSAARLPARQLRSSAPRRPFQDAPASSPRSAVALVIIGAVLKRVADDALDALARVDIFLDRNFVRRPLLEEASEVTVNALGVLANHHEIEVVWFDAFERAKRRIQQPYWP